MGGVDRLMGRTQRQRECRSCGDWYDDPGPGQRDAPAGYCTVLCWSTAKPHPAGRDARPSSLRKAKAPAKRRAISPAAPEQRATVRERACIVTGDHRTDPAHLWPRSLGGCDDALCVVPLRRDVHEAYDRHELDLLPYLVAHGMYAEIAHAVMHARGDLVAVLTMLTGVQWVPSDRVNAGGRTF